jgi:cellulose biosynthesis protein BcsQ
MPIVISFVSQKGGVSKGTLARLIAREYANSGWNVKIADLDVGQGTSFHRQGRRLSKLIMLYFWRNCLGGFALNPSKSLRSRVCRFKYLNVS